MSYTTGTTHYNLPQTTGTDKRDWSDTNQAFQDIDAALYQATQDTAQAALDIDALEVRMDTAEQNIATNAGDISALDGRVTIVEGTVAQHTTQIGDVRTDLEDMICAYNEASATSTHAYAVGDYFIYNDVLYRAIQAIAIGDTIVPDTNCTTTNVTTEILSITPKTVSKYVAQAGDNYIAALNHLFVTPNINKQYEVLIRGAVTTEKFLCNIIKPTEMRFSRTYIGGSNDALYTVTIFIDNNNNATYYRIICSSVDNTITSTNLGSIEVDAGTTFELLEF